MPPLILVLKPSSFGDIIHTLPAVARLKARWPGARISWLVNPEWSPLLRGNPAVDEVVIFPRKHFREWRGWVGLAEWLRGQIAPLRPDLALDFQGLLRTALIGRFSRAGELFGLADAREGACWFYDHVAAIPPGMPHAVERYLALSNAVTAHVGGGVTPAASDKPLSYPLPAGEPLEPATNIEGNYILLHPFARGEGKSLSVAQVQALCRALSSRQIVIVGSCQQAPFRVPDNTVDLLNKTSLLQLLGLIRRASFVISVDSGPAHLAAALDKPLVSIHTWSDPRLVGPYRPDAWILKNGELLQVRALGARDDAFFRPTSLDNLSPELLAAVSRLAISSSDACA